MARRSRNRNKSKQRGPLRRWWNLPISSSSDDETVKLLGEAFAGNRSWRTSMTTERWRLVWAYERQRLIERFGVKGALNLGGKDGGVSGRFNWLQGQTSVPSPNIVRKATDSILNATITQTPPVGVRANGAKFEDQYLIEEFEMALNSVFNTPETASNERMVGRDGVLGGYSYSMPSYRNGQIEVTHLAPWQVRFDPNDARNRRPRTVHVEEFRDRAEVLHLLDVWQPIEGADKKKAKIERMDPIQRSGYRRGDASTWTVYDFELSVSDSHGDADQLRMVHSWHVASARGREDGRYICTVYGGGNYSKGLVLINQAFSRTTLPVTWFDPMPSCSGGIWGTGFGHLMISWQEALDRSMFKMQRALDKYGHIRIVVAKGTIDGPTRAAMSTQGITFIETDSALPGGVPKIYDPQVVRKEDVENITRILQLSSDTYGLNEMLSRGASGLGANASGQALQEEYFRTLDRFSDLLKNWQAYRLRSAEEVLNLLDDVLEHVPDFKAEYTYLGRACSKNWSELRALKERISIALELRGEAALGRGGRTARTQEWAAQGLIDPSLAKEGLLGSPDTTAAARIALAPIRMVEWQLRRVIESEDWFDAKPDADTPAAIAVSRATAAIQRGVVEGAEPETLSRLREYKAQAEALLPPPPVPEAPGNIQMAA